MFRDGDDRDGAALRVFLRRVECKSGIISRTALQQVESWQGGEDSRTRQRIFIAGV